MAAPPPTTAPETGPGSRLRAGWALELALGALVLLVGLRDLDDLRRDLTPLVPWSALIVACLVAATVLCRRLPSAALALVGVVFWAQLLGTVPLLPVELAVAFVAFGCARWGSALTVALSVASPPAAALALWVLLIGGTQTSDLVRQSGLAQVLYAVRAGRTLSLAVVVVVLATLVPWLVGLALRFRDRARASEVSQRVAETEASRAVLERQQAEEIARLRESQAQLARDVHDVVGHSLAVILAQAEAGGYLRDDRPDELKRTLATIAGSARASLRDVRQVLADPDQPTAPAATDLDALVDGVRASGHPVDSTVVGQPRPLPPDLATVAYRVLQEMLTNAMRHGRPSGPIRVERRWEEDLRLEVCNETGGAPADTAGGQGTAGMRRRLDAVGGRLDVRRTDLAGVPTFVATARVPLRVGRRTP